jgi:hypothetical protein
MSNATKNNSISLLSLSEAETGRILCGKTVRTSIRELVARSKAIYSEIFEKKTGMIVLRKKMNLIDQSFLSNS